MPRSPMLSLELYKLDSNPARTNLTKAHSTGVHIVRQHREYTLPNTCDDWHKPVHRPQDRPSRDLGTPLLSRQRYDDTHYTVLGLRRTPHAHTRTHKHQIANTCAGTHIHRHISGPIASQLAGVMGMGHVALSLPQVGSGSGCLSVTQAGPSLEQRSCGMQGAVVVAEASGWSSSEDDGGVPPLRGRGRPRKQVCAGSDASRRPRGRPSAKAATQMLQDLPDSHAPVELTWPPSRLQLFARPIGDEIATQLSALFGLPSQSGRRELHTKLFERCFGKAPRHATSTKVEAEAVGLQGTSQTWFKTQSMFLGACTYLCARQAWASTLSWLARTVDKGRLEPVMYFTSVMQDETPMTMASRTQATGAQVGGEGTHGTAAEREVQKTKVVQSDLMCGFLVRDTEKNAHRLYLCELPIVLFGCADVTGKTLKTCMDELLAFPLLQGVLHRFPLCVDMSGCDRASSNMLMDFLFKNDRPFTARLCGLGCRVHMAHTIQGRVFGILNPCVSGCINLALAEHPAGSTGLLRKAIKEVLKASANVYVGAQPPAADSPAILRRNHIFDLVLGTSLSDRKRRAILEATLQSDPSEDRIDVYLPSVPEVDIPHRLDAWAEQVARALLPRRHPVFCRHRWVTGQGTLAGPALLACCHRLLTRSVPLWLRSMGKRVPPLAVVGDVASVAEPEPPAAEWQVVEYDPPSGAADTDKKSAWAAENERARVNALQFALSDPAMPLVVLLVTMRPLVQLLDKMLDHGSKEWDVAQAFNALQTGRRQFRVRHQKRGQVGNRRKPRLCVSPSPTQHHPR